MKEWNHLILWFTGSWKLLNLLLWYYDTLYLLKCNKFIWSVVCYSLHFQPVQCWTLDNNFLKLYFKEASSPSSHKMSLCLLCFKFIIKNSKWKTVFCDLFGIFSLWEALILSRRLLYVFYLENATISAEKERKPYAWRQNY